MNRDLGSVYCCTYDIDSGSVNGSGLCTGTEGINTCWPVGKDSDGALTTALASVWCVTLDVDSDMDFVLEKAVIFVVELVVAVVYGMN